MNQLLFVFGRKEEVKKTECMKEGYHKTRWLAQGSWSVHWTFTRQEHIAVPHAWVQRWLLKDTQSTFTPLVLPSMRTPPYLFSKYALARKDVQCACIPNFEFSSLKGAPGPFSVLERRTTYLSRELTMLQSQTLLTQTCCRRCAVGADGSVLAVMQENGFTQENVTTTSLLTWPWRESNPRPQGPSTTRPNLQGRHDRFATRLISKTNHNSKVPPQDL